MSARSLNRRSFLATSSVGLVGLGLGLRTSEVHALPRRSHAPVSASLPDIMPDEVMRELATHAMEVALSSGATYADIRLADMRGLEMMIIMGRPLGVVGFEYAYGVRALVGGTWAFGYGTDPTREGITQAVKRTVARAKVLARITTEVPPMVPVPVVQGEWNTPFRIDPFSVSPDDHLFMVGAYGKIASRARGAYGQLTLRWEKETRVIATSEGTLITQRLMSAEPWVYTGAGEGDLNLSLQFSEMPASTAGFELVEGATLQEAYKAAAEETKELLAYPLASAEVGRYAAVLDGQSMGVILGQTLLPALELARISGDQADGAGTSFISLDEAALAQRRFSPHLSFRVDRTPPRFGGAKWDDEGVAIAPFPLVQEGTLVDVLGTRANLHLVQKWYERQSRPLQSHGTTVAASAASLPRGAAPSVIVNEGAPGTTLETLIEGIEDGVLVRGLTDAYGDQQLTGGMFMPRALFEVKKGKITRRLRHGMIQFRTEPFWKGVAAAGDTTTRHIVANRRYDWHEQRNVTQVVDAPAMRVAELDVTRRPVYDSAFSARGGA